MDTGKALIDVVTWLFASDPVATPEVERRARMLFLDTLGCMIAGLAKPEIQAAVQQVLRDAPERFILGADCTLPGDIGWDNIRTAIATAHGYG